MALDEAFFNLNSPATLRFYSWEKPTLSLGCFQKINNDIVRKCEKSGIDIVRRPTGGRAILHQSEITYSVSAAYDDFPSPSTLREIYKTLGLWQVRSLASLGIEASMSGKNDGKNDYSKNDSCFLTSTPYEVAVQGKKICGSAQKRGKQNFLQHGSLLIDVDADLFLSLYSDDLQVNESFTYLRKENISASKNEIIEVMSENFSHIIGCKLERGVLSYEEIKEKNRLDRMNRIIS